MDYFTSDLHFCHDREFLYGPRGFSSVAEMNEAIIKNFNESVGWEDRLYILGDVMMGFDIEAGCRLLGRLPGEKYIIRGNHDSDKKLSAMADVANVKVLGLAELYEYGKRKFYLSHYPTCTGNFSVTEKKYYSNRFQGAYEIVSLTGTITTRDGAFYQHLHMSAADRSGAVVGGHLNSAVVSATCEMLIRLLPGTVERCFDEKVGLNLFRFEERS